MGKQPGRLDHIADAAPELFWIIRLDVFATHEDVPLVGGDQRIDHPQHRGLAAAGGTGKDKKGAVLNCERQIGDRRRAAKNLRHIAQLDHRFFLASADSMSKIKFAKSASRMTGSAPTKTRSSAYWPIP